MLNAIRCKVCGEQVPVAQKNKRPGSKLCGDVDCTRKLIYPRKASKR